MQRWQLAQSAMLFLKSSKLGLPHPPLAGACVPPHHWFWEGAHSLAGEGVGESRFEREDRHCGNLGMYFVAVGKYKRNSQ
jgi:hypothetical protein